MGRGVFPGEGVSNAPTVRGGAPALHTFGVLLYLCLYPLTQNDQIRRGYTHYGRGLFLGQSRSLSHGCMALADSILGRSPLLMRIYSLTQNDQIRHGTT